MKSVDQFFCKFFCRVILFFLFFSLAGCASKEKRGADIGQRLESQNYASLIDKNTRHSEKYESFYNKFEIYVTFINSEMQAALLQKQIDALQLDEKQAQSERERMFQENTTQTKFAISFFVPSVRLNDLHKPNSIWKIYLDVGGRRYEGKASRRNSKLEDLQSMLPYHNRWSVAYDVVFNVPLSGVEHSPASFTITSTQGAAKMSFLDSK